MVHTLRNSVAHYLDHLEDAPWVVALVERHGVAAVLQECADVLDEQDPGNVHEVTTLLRDLGLRGKVQDDTFTQVRALLPIAVLPALRRLLEAPNLQVRMAGIYTIGKLSIASEAAALRKVFASYVDRDPLCLARLVDELIWLGDRRGVAARLKQMTAHNSFLVRWSTLQRLDCPGLRTLASDPAPLVAAEAKHRLLELELEVAGRRAQWIPEAAWRTQRRAVASASPRITFGTVEMLFLNQLAHTGQADYAIEQLAEFVQTLVVDAAK